MRSPGRDNRRLDTPRGATPSEPALESDSLRGATQGTPKPSSGSKGLGTDGCFCTPHLILRTRPPTPPSHLILRLRREAGRCRLSAHLGRGRGGRVPAWSDAGE